MTTVFLDFETRSEADLTKVGAWAYSEHSSTEVICACWAVDEGPVKRWGNPDVGYVYLADPEAARSLGQLAEDPDVLFEAHNVAFEYALWHNVCVARYGWPEIPLERWRDTMAVACYYAMPAKLENLCRALGIPGKDPAGTRLISKYSKLNLKTSKREIPPEDLQKFVDYCATDVERERQCSYILGDLPDQEETYFLHDLMVGARGLRLDLHGVAAAAEVVDRRSADLAEKFREITGLNPTQVKQVVKWLRAQGLDEETLPNLQAATIEDLLEGDGIPSEARRALQYRLDHSKASTRKLDAMTRQAGKDGRARFQFRYHGAVTGRTTGAGFQPLNLNRGFDVEFKWYEDAEARAQFPGQLVRDVMRGDPEWLDLLYGDAMDAVGKASRHWIVPDKGSRIIAGDFVSVEAVLLACAAGEDWKIEAFRNKEPIYERMAEKIHGLPPGTVTKKTHPMERQDGKVGELAGGYQGWIGAWRKFDNSDRHTDEAVKGFMSNWRKEHPATTRLWRMTETAAIEAVLDPGDCYGYRGIDFERVDGWLTMILHNGKRLWYWAPQVRMAMPRWHDPEKNEECASGDCKCEEEPKLTYMSQKEGQWRRVGTYGGKLVENWDQATSREILKPCEIALQAAGYPVILGVYDEIICEVPNAHGSPEEYLEIVGETVDGLEWARGWPVRMDTPWQGGRYKK